MSLDKRLDTPLMRAALRAQQQSAQSSDTTEKALNQFLSERMAGLNNRAASRGQARLSFPHGAAFTPPVISGQSPKGSLAAFLNAVAQVESGGNYNAANSIGALGKYQILSSNIPGWSKEALGHSVSPEQFLHSPHLQEAIARYKLGQYVQKYGYLGAAKAWNSGRAGSTNPAVEAYAAKVLSLMRR